MAVKDKEDFIKKYNELAEKYSLPKVEDIENNFVFEIRVGKGDTRNPLLIMIENLVDLGVRMMSIILKRLAPVTPIDTIMAPELKKEEREKYEKLLYKISKELLSAEVKILSDPKNEEKVAGEIKKLYTFYINEVMPEIIELLKKSAETAKQKVKKKEEKKETKYLV